MGYGSILYLASISAIDTGLYEAPSWMAQDGFNGSGM